MGRPVSWYTKITAPPEALAFYEALAKAMAAGVFADCHVFHGAVNKNGVPVLLDPGSHRALAGPVLLSAFLGLSKKGRRLCTTHGCMNPLHYADSGLAPALQPSEIPAPDIDHDVAPIKDWVALITYLRDKNDILVPMTKEEYRALVPEEDIPNIYFHEVFDELPPGWKK